MVNITGCCLNFIVDGNESVVTFARSKMLASTMNSWWVQQAASGQRALQCQEAASAVPRTFVHTILLDSALRISAANWLKN